MLYYSVCLVPVCIYLLWQDLHSFPFLKWKIPIISAFIWVQSSHHLITLWLYGKEYTQTHTFFFSDQSHDHLCCTVNSNRTYACKTQPVETLPFLLCRTWPGKSPFYGESRRETERDRIQCAANTLIWISFKYLLNLQPSVTVTVCVSVWVCVCVCVCQT